jgi:sialidase-1
VQLSSGRLIVPCNHAVKGPTRYYGHIIFSDDGGKTWASGGNTGVNVNECQVVELADKRIMLNGRDVSGKGHRLITVSSDEGLSWQTAHPDLALIEPKGCEASFIAASGPDSHQYLLFANPADPNVRQNLTIRASKDEGYTWFKSSTLWSGFSAYSSMVAIDEHTILIAFEHGKRNPYEQISLMRLSFDGLVSDH